MRHRVRRLARVAAFGSLLMLGWSLYQPFPDASSPLQEITLWTAGASAGATPAGPHAALPGATNAPREARPVPDAGYLRRAHPALRRVRIEGDGVDAAGALALRDRTVLWQRPPPAGAGAPELIYVAASRILSVGERVRVQGRIRGLAPGAALMVSLEGPDGRREALELRAPPAGDTVFSLTSGTAVIAPGAFAWTLRLGPQGEPLVLGAWATAPDPPRVLILQAAPTVEGGRLQRWLTGTGAPVTMRTRVSADHMRFTSAHAAPAEIPSLDAGALESFDLVVAREPALLELSAGERDALDAAITLQGVGLLVMGEPGAGGPDARFSPWPLRSDERGETGNETRLARLRLPDGRELAEPIPVPTVELDATPPGRWLLRDPQDRTFGAATPRGRGWVARTLLTDTWRWLQGGHPESYASYWSAILSAIARPAAATRGQWSLETGTGPAFVGDAVRLSWTGAPDAALPAVEARAAGATPGAPVRLALARDPREPARGQALYFPSHPGWHEVAALPSGPAIAFHVHAAATLPALRAEQRRDVTARLVDPVASPMEPSPPSDEARFRPALATWAWFAVLVASLTALWWEQRR